MALNISARQVNKPEIKRKRLNSDFNCPICNERKCEHSYLYCSVSDKLNCKRYNSQLLMFLAIKMKDIKLIDFLLKEEVDSNNGSIFGNNSFFVLAIKEFGSSGNIDVIKKLIIAEADVNFQGPIQSRFRRENNLTPLCYAIDNKWHEIAELLINYGANVNPICIKEDCESCESPLTIAARVGDEYLIDLLLKKGADVNEICNFAESPLQAAIKHSKIMHRLLNEGANINGLYGFQKRTALHKAVSERNLKAVQLLLNNPLIDVNVVAPVIGTALHVATRWRDLRCIDYILNANPDVNIINSMNLTPIETVTFNRMTNVHRKIEEHIVKIHAANFYLSDSNLAAISGDRFNDFYVECCKQVKAMKKNKIVATSHVTYYDLFIMSDKKLVLCLESAEDEEILLPKFHTKFPLYAGMIEYKLKRVVQWKQLYEKLNDVIYSKFNAHFPYPVMKIIQSYFSPIELYRLKKSRFWNLKKH